MPQLRRLAATTAIVATLLLVLASVATAHRGPHFGPRAFDNVWIGTAEADTYTAPDKSRDKIIGRAGNDVLRAGAKRDVVRGNLGDDAIEGGAGSDRIHGGLGDDRLSGGDQPDRIFGGPGADGINGGDGPDRIWAGLGDDTIVADDGKRDWIRCGAGEDTVTADERDVVSGDCENVTRVPGDEAGG
jgi:hypothetical protein